MSVVTDCGESDNEAILILRIFLNSKLRKAGVQRRTNILVRDQILDMEYFRVFLKHVEESENPSSMGHNEQIRIRIFTL